jgi:hypothetical protein
VQRDEGDEECQMHADDGDSTAVLDVATMMETRCAAGPPVDDGDKMGMSGDGSTWRRRKRVACGRRLLDGSGGDGNRSPVAGGGS